MLAGAFVLSLLAPVCGAGASTTPEPPNARAVTVLFGTYEPPLPEEVVVDPPVEAGPAPAPVPLPAPSAADAIRYMRSLPPDVLIRIAFADTPHTEKMLAIARRESGLGKHGEAHPFDAACSADNPSSSAAGLFQTLGGWAGLASTIGVTWDEVAGPDCLGDVLLARAIYARSGLGPWQ